MSADAGGIGVTLVLLGALFGLAEVLHRRGVDGERTRKLVHIASGLWIVALPWVLHDVRTMGVLAVVFAAILLLTRSLGWLPSIHQVERRSIGSVLYPVGVALAVPFTWDRPRLFVISVVVLSLGDGFAALVGQRWGRHRYRVGDHSRTAEGSATIGGIAAVAATVGLAGSVDPVSAVAVGVVLGALVAAVEGLSPNGLDNVVVPLVAAVFLDRVVGLDRSALLALVGQAVVVGVIAGVSAVRRNLTVSGALAAWVVGFVVVAVAGWAWLAAILAVFVAVNAGSRIRRGRKPLEGKGATRDHVQILCNVGLTAPAAVGWGATHHPAFLGAFLGALAFAAADTLASELGVLSGKPPISITTLRPVAPGESGGVSGVGYLAALVGSLLPPVGLALGGGARPGWVVASVGAGLVGTTLDSLLGDRVQARYRCLRCGRTTEDRSCCGVPAQHLRGFVWMDNDAVNLGGSIASAVLGAMLVGGSA